MVCGASSSAKKFLAHDVLSLGISDDSIKLSVPYSFVGEEPRAGSVSQACIDLPHPGVVARRDAHSMNFLKKKGVGRSRRCDWLRTVNHGRVGCRLLLRTWITIRRSPLVAGQRTCSIGSTQSSRRCSVVALRIPPRR